MANWRGYSGEDLLSLKEAIKAPGLRRFMEEERTSGYRDLLNSVKPDEARGRIRLAEYTLGLNETIRTNTKRQSPLLTTGLK